MDKSNTCTVRHNIQPAQLQAQYILHDQVWGLMAGAHSLPSLSEVNKLKAREPCKTIKNIQGYPYTYTVGSCLFDSTIFCLSRSKYYTAVTKYGNGSDLRATLYDWALTTLTTNGNYTLSDMATRYSDNRELLMGANVGVMDDDEMKVISECPTFVEYVLYMQDNTEEYALEYDLWLIACFLGIHIYIYSDHVMIPMMIKTTTIEMQLIIITQYFHMMGKMNKVTHINISPW